MPELPEIESIRRYLVSRGVEGKRIERVEIGWPDSVAAPSADIEAFANGVSNKPDRAIASSRQIPCITIDKRA